MTEEETSEFGKGLTYCLALFLEHSERPRFDPTFKVFSGMDRKNMQWEMWFNAASDHLYELNIPAKFPKGLTERIETFLSKCLGWRMAWDGAPIATEEDFKWAIREAKDLLMMIDKRLGAEVLRGEYE